ncbi:major facilitator superfamily sugar transporter [Gluconobacter thailandicus F149-1 = NBRC 100600]|uniref:Sugar-proton symporter n=1 Tax=Gluconobacter thailandicus NBRC 3257 TaxID=1381097 RepID=A0ABQ0IUC6_GLUTH|nr:sugar porter family MFS transporter [Gluconobacter thailandicus]KXV53187.1 D-galactose transporter GalP [Gluconobacter thailandicus]GAC88031.1 sugar-proton symporter [Gluconobacter thailandicus NBRC 3255]GAD25802.1 sugar-proton symporter [Gluconobacter thailandicus NBRC 3257]GAN93917.1 major facilitator superfamily sugar transporter [Gluconobacter thailandicus F149-1 = NBRC 100600]GBR60226.1 sugar-proton symporter [Gluconobacter thailandicus F149-1 = NBRC 100600]
MSGIDLSASPPVSLNGKSVLTAILAAVAGLMFGLDLGVISGALKFIGQEFNVTDFGKECIVSAMMVGAALGAVSGGRLSFLFGRKRLLLSSAFLFVLGSLLCALATSVTFLIIGRMVLGVSVGIASFTAPLYISEIAHQHYRGSLISVYQLMITVGIFVAFISDALLAYSGSWRWMLGIVAIPGVVFLLGVLLLPDSPRWLVLRGRKDEAFTVLHELRGHEGEARSEIADIEEQLAQIEGGYGLFKANANFRRSVFLGILLQTMQQFTGIIVVMYYAPRIFEVAGFGDNAAMWGTAIVGLVNVLSTFIAIGFVDKWGRRPMLIAGFIIMTIGMFTVGTLLYFGTGDSELARYGAVTMLLAFIVGFAFSAGPLVWILCSEVQPIKGRDFGIACSTFTNWVTNMIVGLTFLTLLNTIGNAQTFWMYAAFNAFFIYLTLKFVPETRGVTLEQIERNLMAGKPLNRIGL